LRVLLLWRLGMRWLGRRLRRPRHKRVGFWGLLLGAMDDFSVLTFW
jgi:hypothetical protein